MNKKRLFRFLFLGSVFVLSLSKGYSINRTLYYMEDVPQRIYINPAFFPQDYVTFIGLPVLSNIQLEAGIVGAKYSNFASSENGIRKINVNKLQDDLFLWNIKAFEDVHLDVLSFGFKSKIGFLSFRTGIRGATDLRVKKGLINLIAEGNTPGEKLRVGPSLFSGSWAYYDFGWAGTINRNLRIGVRAKILGGIAAATTWRSKANVITNSHDNSIDIDYHYKISASAPISANLAKAFDMSKPPDFEANKILNPLTNPGLAFDFGLEYRATDLLAVSFSVQDLGAIYFKYDPVNVQINRRVKIGGEVDFSDLKNKNINLASLVDSLKKKFDFKTLAGDTTRKGFIFTPPFQLNFGAKIFATNNTTATLDYNFQMFGFLPSHSLTLALNQRIYQGYSFTLSYSYLYRRLDNLGAGLNFRLGPVQFYAAADNILGAIKFTRAALKNTDYIPYALGDVNGINLNFGININLLDYKAIRNKKQWGDISSSACIEVDPKKRKKRDLIKQDIIKKSRGIENKNKKSNLFRFNKKE